MRRLFRGSTALDWLLLLILVAGTVGSIPVAAGAGRGTVALVESNGRVVARLPLGENGRVEVQGTAGRVVVEVRENRVAVTAAECPAHVCVRTGWKGHAGDVIVCVPNRTVIRVAGPDEGRPEGITG